VDEELRAGVFEQAVDEGLKAGEVVGVAVVWWSFRELLHGVY
jgi:hypothetical protein